jgi:hypothetical protein
MRKAFLALMLVCAAIVGPAIAQQVVPPYRYGEQPVVLIPNIDNVILGELGLVHYWGFEDGPGGTPSPCATQLADLVTQDTVATVTPSPVPLNCSTPVASPYPYLNQTGMVQDGSTAAEVTNGVAGQGQWFTPASLGILSNLCNNNAGGTCTNAFSIGCIVLGGNLSSGSYFFSADGTTGGLALGASLSSGLILNDRGSFIAGFAMFASGHPYDILYTFNPTGNVSLLYLDGVLAESVSSPAPQVSPNSNTYFGSETGSAGGWNGRISKCRLFNDTETAAEARAQYAATGFW